MTRRIDAQGISKLPTSVATKIAELRQSEMLALAQVRAVGAEIAKQRQEQMRLELRLRELQRPQPRLELGTTPSGHGVARSSTVRPLSDDDALVISTKNELASVERELARLLVTEEGLQNTWNPLSNLVRRLEAYLADDCAGITLALHHVEVSAPLKKGEAITDAIARLQRRHRELVSDRLRTVAAPITSEMAKQLARNRVEVLAKTAIDLCPLIDRGDVSCITAPRRRINEVAYSATGAGLRAGATSINLAVDDALAFWAWLQPVTLLERIYQEIDSCSDDQNALTPEARTEALAQIDSDLLATAREEAAACEQAERIGINVTVRPTIDVRAFLHLSDQMPVPKGVHDA
jgi:hypothetical protein